jgi:hypothetical protein
LFKLAFTVKRGKGAFDLPFCLGYNFNADQ